MWKEFKIPTFKIPMFKIPIISKYQQTFSKYQQHQQAKITPFQNTRISITLWEPFPSFFTLWEVLFPPLLSARSSTGEVGTAPILLEWNQVLHASFYFFDDFEWKNLGGKENELRPQWLSPHRWTWGEGEQLGKWEARRTCLEEARSAQQGALFVNLTIWLLLYKFWLIASHPKLNR